MIGQFTAVYQKHSKWYVGYVEEIPGVNTQGRTLSETKRNLKEALVLVLEANRAIARATAGLLGKAFPRGVLYERQLRKTWAPPS